MGDLVPLRRRQGAAQDNGAADQVNAREAVRAIGGLGDDEDQPGPRVVGGGPGDSEWINVAAWQVGPRDRLAERRRPQHLPIRRVEGVHGVLLCGRDQPATDQ